MRTIHEFAPSTSEKNMTDEHEHVTDTAVKNGIAV